QAARGVPPARQRSGSRNSTTSTKGILMAATSTEARFDELRVPALKAHMGDWIYYAAFLKFRDIAQRVFLADEIHQHQGLRDMIQRTIDESRHAESIKQYLLTKPQRFFNAL